MKNYLATTIAATGLIIFILSINAGAQTNTRITADIPFDFYVGMERLPGGRYEFEPASPRTYPSPLIIRPVMKAGRKTMIVPALANDPKKGDGFAVIFNRYGSVHYLSGISSQAGGLALRLSRTSAEKQTAKQHERAVPVAVRPRDTTGN